jgi:hypothetical protein
VSWSEKVELIVLTLMPERGKECVSASGSEESNEFRDVLNEKSSQTDSRKHVLDSQIRSTIYDEFWW